MDFPFSNTLSLFHFRSHFGSSSVAILAQESRESSPWPPLPQDDYGPLRAGLMKGGRQLSSLWHVVSVAVVVVVMGRCRSYYACLESGLPLSPSQLRRLRRDQHYYRPPTCSFSEVLDPDLHGSGRAMLAGLQVHQKLSDQTQVSSPSGKKLAHVAYRSAAISRSQLQSARDVLTKADMAKHMVKPKGKVWADMNDEGDEETISFGEGSDFLGLKVNECKKVKVCKEDDDEDEDGSFSFCGG